MDELDDCLENNCCWKRALTLSTEILPILRKIYGGYESSLSYYMLRHVKILFNIPERKHLKETEAFYKKTKNWIVITHGQDHRLYHAALDLTKYL